MNACRGTFPEASLSHHPLRVLLRRLLLKNNLLGYLTGHDLDELEKHLIITEVNKDDVLLVQGATEMDQYFILEGVLKRVVSSPEGKEMILRFSQATQIETSYVAWCLDGRSPFSICAASKARVAKCPMPIWVEFMSRHPILKQVFEREIMQLMSEVMVHTTMLLLLDADGRMKRFLREKPGLAKLLSKKEMALHLNISPETLSRLPQPF